jgi:hypothetical protein
MTDAEVAAFNLQAWDQAFTWNIFEWLRSITKLPLLIKGVLRADDACRGEIVRFGERLNRVAVAPCSLDVRMNRRGGAQEDHQAPATASNSHKQLVAPGDGERQV